MGISGRSADSLARLLRRFTALAVVVFSVAMVALWIFAAPSSLPADYTAAECRRVTVLDDVTGDVIVGAEDLVLANSENELLLTAHDRRDSAQPSGGLYSISLFTLEAGDQTITASRIYGQGDGEETAFRPHGLALSSDGSRLALVNRPASGRAEVLIGPFDGENWAPDQRLRGERLCRANDLAFASDDGAILDITLDRADCEPSMRDLLPGAATGRLTRFDGRSLTDTASGYAFPNGIIDGYVAETRAMRVIRPDGPPLRMPGGPDNLSVDDAGWLVAALHPKLIHLWLYRSGWNDKAPSRIIRVDPQDGEMRVLYDDVHGTLFSGATSAIYGDGLLVAGSAYDEGLLVCQEGLQ